MLSRGSNNKQPHNSAFPSLNLSMFTEEDGTSINMTEKKLNEKKMPRFTQLWYL